MFLGLYFFIQITPQRTPVSVSQISLAQFICSVRNPSVHNFIASLIQHSCRQHQPRALYRVMYRDCDPPCVRLHCPSVLDNVQNPLFRTPQNAIAPFSTEYRERQANTSPIPILSNETRERDWPSLLYTITHRRCFTIFPQRPFILSRNARLKTSCTPLPVFAEHSTYLAPISRATVPPCSGVTGT